MTNRDRGTLAYFPRPRPDEPLYGVIARYARHMAVPSTPSLRRDLFGDDRQISPFDLPNKIGRIAVCLPPETGLTASRLVRRHTMFPYYRAVASLEHSRLTFHEMVGEGTLVGSIARFGPRIPRVNHLRFCAECDAEAIVAHGERHWRREHNLPGVLACTRHRCILRVSKIRVGNGARRYEAATEEACGPDQPAVLEAVREEQFAIVLALADASVAMLRTGRSARANDREFQRAFRASCIPKGFELGRTERSREVLEAAGASTLRFLEPVWPRIFDKGARSGWLRTVDLVKPRVADPVLRILAEQVVARMPDHVGPFGTGPWPCLNPLSEHRGEMVVNAVTTRSETKGVTGLFACECGYAYTRVKLADGRITPPRLREYGPSLRALIAESFELGRAISATGKICGLGHSHLRRLAASMGYTDWPKAWNARGLTRQTAEGRAETKPINRKAETRETTMTVVGE